MEPSLSSMEIHAYMEKGSTIVEKTGYGTAWKNTDGRLFVMFSGSNEAYEIGLEELDLAPIGRDDQYPNYTLEQTLGSWGPTQQFRRYLVERTEIMDGVTAFFDKF